MENRMMKVALMLISLGFLVLAGCSFGPHHSNRADRCANCPMQTTAVAKAQKASEQTAERRDILFVCDCGDQCRCNSMGVKPGNCSCGKPMKGYHVVRVEGSEALLCTCGENCRCTLDPKNPEKCACGKQVKRVDLQGSGIFFCNCGGSCSCNTLSAQAGQCACGMPLKKANQFSSGNGPFPQSPR